MDLSDLTRELEALREDALASIATAGDVAALEALEVDILGKKGRLTTVLRGIGALPADDRPRVGAVANAIRGAIEGALAERGASLRGAALTGRLAGETLDVTTPGRPIRRGSSPTISIMCSPARNGRPSSGKRWVCVTTVMVSLPSAGAQGPFTSAGPEGPFAQGRHAAIPMPSITNTAAVVNAQPTTFGQRTNRSNSAARSSALP